MGKEGNGHRTVNYICSVCNRKYFWLEMGTKTRRQKTGVVWEGEPNLIDLNAGP